MQQETGQPNHHHVRLDSSGRIRLPVSLREKLGIEHGDPVVVIEDDHQFRIETATDSLRKAQNYFSSFVPEGVSLADDLISERRDEAARE